MKDEKPKKTDAIYFDTNIFKKLTPHLDDTRLDQILNLTEILNIGIFIPRIVLKETVDLLQSEINEIISKTNKYNKFNIFTINTIPTIEKYEQTLEKFLLDKRISIIETPSISFDRILSMAIKHEPPFKKEDKGFKDTIILLTILDHAKISQNKSIIFFSEDPIFLDNRVWKLAGLYNVDINVIAKMEDGINGLSEQLSEEVRKLNDELEKTIIEHLNEKPETIYNHIKNGKFSAVFLRNNSKEYPFFGHLINVNDINPQIISKVIITKKEEDGDSKKFTFLVLVKTEFKLLFKIQTKDRIFGPYFLKGRKEDSIVPSVDDVENVEERVITYDVTLKCTLEYKKSINKYIDYKILSPQKFSF